MEAALSRKIKLKAAELGFSRVGVALAESLVQEGRQLCEWLAHSYQASMQWIGRDAKKRIDPTNVLPDVKSVLCVALNYFTPAQHLKDPAIGKISRYAWGDDYHIVLMKRLQKLFNFIKSEIPGVSGKLYVDTGPVMDKVWAVRAGIGWMGKHTNLITRDYGSWVFLGEILLDVELEYNKPVLDLCGTCTACIDACPTHAIVQPYMVDSNLCISYLTIEHRGELPHALVPKFKNWVYGCDICQDVCPWNRFQKETIEPAFQPRGENIRPRLAELAEMNQKEFNLQFQRSPVKRTKHYGLVRNARAVIESQQRSV